MKHYIEHRCASCGTVVGGTTRKRTAIGRPFEECGRCGTYVPREPFEEWALMSRRARATLLLSSGSFAGALGLAPAAVLGLVAALAGRHDALQTLIVVGGLGLLVALGVWSAWLGRLLGGSRRRMSDPWYQAKLAQFAIQTSKQGLDLARRGEARAPSQAT